MKFAHRGIVSALLVSASLTCGAAVGDDAQAVPHAPQQQNEKDPFAQIQAINTYFSPLWQQSNPQALVVDLQGNLNGLTNATNHGIAFLQRSGDDGIGATLTPVDESIRAQLGLQAQQGMLVSSVVAGGPAERVGLQAGDILLRLGDKPLGKPEGLLRELKEVGEKPAKLHLLRAGKPMAISVKATYRVTLSAAEDRKPSFFIGTGAEQPDATLRMHLPQLPQGQGLIVTSVVADSPAARAGLKVNDIVFAFGGKPLTDVGSLVREIQAVGANSTPVKLLRGGHEMTITVTPEPRKETAEAASPPTSFIYNIVPQMNVQGYLPTSEQSVASQLSRAYQTVPAQVTEHNSGERLEKQLDNLMAEVKRLQEAVAGLQAKLKQR